MKLEEMTEEMFKNVIKPIYPSKKEYWMQAYYVGIRPSVFRDLLNVAPKRSTVYRELLANYIYFDIDWYMSQNNYYPLVTTAEHHAHFLGLELEEYMDGIDELLFKNRIKLVILDEGFVILAAKSIEDTTQSGESHVDDLKAMAPEYIPQFIPERYKYGEDDFEKVSDKLPF